VADEDRAVIVHSVRLPLFGGMTVEQAKARAGVLGLDPDSREARLVRLEQVDTGWEAVVRFEVGAKGVVPVGVEVRSTRGELLTRAVWDRVRLQQVMDEAVALVAWLGPVSRRPDQAEPFERRPQNRGRGKGRPAQYSDEHYRRVGAVYMAAVGDATTRHAPVRAVAKAFASEVEGDLLAANDKRARSWVREARRRGYIREE
jgi:hypothetical protein